MKRSQRVDSRTPAKRRAGPTARVVPRGGPSDETVEARHRLTHDVEVHQLELEVQNRALRENQELLEESRARYAELYDYAPIGYVTLDRRATILQLNLAAAGMIGRERKSLVQAALRPALTPASRRALDAHLRACFKDKRTHAVELTIATRNGEPRIVELVSVPATAPEHAAVVHSAMHDISQRKVHERQREELLEREHEARLLAESASRMKEEFLAIVSHELRTPLAPMMMWTKTLRAGGADDALRLRAVDALEACLTIQSAMIDDLVDLARGRLGKLRVERRPTNLQDAVNAAVEAMAPACAAKHIRLSVDLEAAPAWVLGDATRLQQVIANLLSNAVKFTSEGGHVSVSLLTNDRDVTLYVRDDGEGIDAASLDLIFEPFHRADAVTTPRQSGLGLGLSIVRQLVAQHDGHVVAESQGKGRGACFMVTIPRAPSPRERPR